MTILLESAIRVTLIAAIIALVLFAMRIKTPSVLHAVWVGVVVVMMLLPAWVAWGPKASLPVLPPDRTAVSLLPPPLPAGLAEATPGTSPVRQDGGYASLDPIAAIYLLGFGVLLLRLAIGTLRANRLTSASCVVPITVGFLRPRIILPECSREWSPAQLDVVLTHEGEHVRRRDPLFQWLALLNRAIFWFHPLAWWLERKLSGLAEEACDAAVLAKGHDPRDYSGYLLDLARKVNRSGLRVGMAMPGAMLPQRIRRLLSGVPTPKISRPRAACTAVLCMVTSAIIAVGTLAQAQRPDGRSTLPAFEVASVRAVKPGDHLEPTFDVSPGSITVRRQNLRSLVAWAYHVDGAEISGPGWLDTQDFDITAKAAGSAAADQLKLMFQNLLEKRFNLELHREQKIQPIYLLSVDKGGPKMREVQEEPRRGGRIGFTEQVFTYQMVNHVSQLAEMLPNFLDGRPVQDKTGLTGVYEITLDVAMDAEQIKRVPQPGMAFTGFGYASGVFDAVEKLGLKLVSAKGPVDVLVIDRVEKPSEN